MTLIAAVCLSIALLNWWATSQELAGDLEANLLYNHGPADVDANFDFILPEWLPNSPIRITTLDFVLADMHCMSTEDILFYSKFDCVHTIRLPNYQRLSDRVLKALESFPNLRTVLIDKNCSAFNSDSFECRSYRNITSTSIGNLQFIVTSKAFDLVHGDG